MIDGYIEVPEIKTMGCVGCDFLAEDGKCLHPESPTISMYCCENYIIYKRKERQ